MEMVLLIWLLTQCGLTTRSLLCLTPPHNRANDFCIFCIFVFCIFCIFVFMTTRSLVSHLHLHTIVQMYFVFLVFLAFLVFLVFLVFWPQDLLSASHLHTIVEMFFCVFSLSYAIRARGHWKWNLKKDRPISYHLRCWVFLCGEMVGCDIVRF